MTAPTPPPPVLPQPRLRRDARVALLAWRKVAAAIRRKQRKAKRGAR